VKTKSERGMQPSKDSAIPIIGKGRVVSQSFSKSFATFPRPMGLLRNRVYTSVLWSCFPVMKSATLDHGMYATMKRFAFSTPHAHCRFPMLFCMFRGWYFHLMSLYVNGPSKGICRASQYRGRTVYFLSR
jgi:hypothetical protein